MRLQKQTIRVLPLIFVFQLIQISLAVVFASESEEVVFAAAEWLKLIDQAEYQEAWKRTSSITKKYSPYGDWYQSTKSSRAGWGVIKDRKLEIAQPLSHVANGTFGEVEYFLKFNTRLESGKTAEEIMSMTKEKNGWRVVGYVINSDT